MDIQQIIAQLQTKFGDKIDIAKITDMLKGLDLSNLSLSDIIDKLKAANLLGGLDGATGNLVDGLKDKASDLLGGMLGGK